MLNKKDRKDKLNEAGVNTGKFFSIELPDGVAPGSKLHVVISENGIPTLMTDSSDNNDPILNQIIEDGYVRNTKLHRRFVMAQMFRMLNYTSRNGYDKGFSACLKECYPYSYTFKMMLEEVRVLSKLETRDKDTFDERSSFFTRQVVVAVMEDYIKKLQEHIKTLPVYKCKGIPYVRIKGKNIFCEDINTKIINPLRSCAWSIAGWRRGISYADIYRALKRFIGLMVKLPHNTPKSRAWIDAFKGEGAYYTLKNLVMFHDCFIITPNTNLLNGNHAVHYVESLVQTYAGEGWRMMGFLKKIIKDNNFDFKKRMAEIYDN